MGDERVRLGHTMGEPSASTQAVRRFPWLTERRLLNGCVVLVGVWLAALLVVLAFSNMPDAAACDRGHAISAIAGCLLVAGLWGLAVSLAMLDAVFPSDRRRRWLHRSALAAAGLTYPALMITLGCGPG